MRKIRSFIRKETSFFLLLPLLAILFIPLALWSESSFISKEFSEDIPSAVPFFRSIVLFTALGGICFFFHYSPLPLLFRADKEKRIELLVAVAFTLGFANLLFGFITSFIGQLLFFVIGLLIQAIHKIAQKKSPQFSPRVLLLAITFFLCYTTLSIFLAPDKTAAFSTFRLLIWLLVIPLLFSFYPFTKKTFQYFSRFTLGVGYIYLLAIGTLYVLVSLQYHSPLDAAFHLDKNYFYTAERIAYSPQLLLANFGFNHYTFITYLLFAPLAYSLVEDQSCTRRVSYTIGLLLFTHLLQCRLWIVTLPLLIGVAYLHRLKSHKLKILLFLAGLVALGVLGYIAYTAHLFEDTARTTLLQIAFEKTKENVILGHGLATATPYLKSLGMWETHFHNSFVQVYFEMGLIGLLFTLSILALYATVCVKRKNFAGVLLVLALIGLMTTDEIVNTTTLFLDVLLLTSLYLHPCGKQASCALQKRI